MKRSLVLLSALVFALVLALSNTFTTPTVSSADINEKCNACLVRANKQYQNCIDQQGETPYCGEKMNEDIVRCYRNFCEQ